MERQIICGDAYLTAELPDRTFEVSPGFSLKMEATEDLEATAAAALDRPLDTKPLKEIARAGMKVTVAFDDPTVPCYAPVWATTLPLIIDRLESAGVKRRDISLVCANSLHRRFTHDEIGRTIGEDLVTAHHDRLDCHDAEDPEAMVHLGTTSGGYDVTLGRSVTDADLCIYLNCSTMRAFSGGWKSICVGLSDYRSIAHHHTPDIMSMSLDRNRMHEMLDEMGSLAEEKLGRERFFKIETVLAAPFAVNTMYGGSVGATREAVLETLRAHQPHRRNLVEEPVDVVIYGVPDWSPYAAFSHTNPILDLVSTGLGYLGGMIQALGKKGCTVILVTPATDRWNMTHHPAYREVWEDVLPAHTDPEYLRHHIEPELARRQDYIDAYRSGNAFHPVHATMALYPLKRLRHAKRIINVGASDPAIPARVGFDHAESVERAIAMAEAEHGAGCSIAFVDNPMAFNRS